MTKAREYLGAAGESGFGWPACLALGKQLAPAGGEAAELSAAGLFLVLPCIFFLLSNCSVCLFQELFIQKGMNAPEALILRVGG